MTDSENAPGQDLENETAIENEIVSAGEKEEKRSSVLGWLLFLPLGILALFAVNLFILEPLINQAISPVVATMVYIIFRVLGLVLLAYGLARYAYRNRFQTMSTVLLVGFIDQVLLKGVRMKLYISENPSILQEFNPSNTSIFVNLAAGYLFFVPFVLIIGFFGMEATRFKRDWTYRP